MPKLYCPCGQGEELWGEFWWVGGSYRWLFFGCDETSEVFGEQVERCPVCGRSLEHKDLSTSRSS